MAHAARVARIGQLRQGIGQGAQGLQEGGFVACDHVFHEGCNVSREVVKSPHKTHGGPLCCARDSREPVAGADYPYRFNPKRQGFSSMPIVRGQPPEPVSDNSDSPPPRDFAFTLPPTVTPRTRPRLWCPMPQPPSRRTLVAPCPRRRRPKYSSVMPPAEAKGVHPPASGIQRHPYTHLSRDPVVPREVGNQGKRYR